MQASGADTILLSRWRTGGRSAFDLAEAFVKNYEKEPSANAWKDAVAELVERDVVVDEEPRLKKLGLSEAIPKGISSSTLAKRFRKIFSKVSTKARCAKRTKKTRS